MVFKKGHKHSERTKRKISQSRKGKGLDNKNALGNKFKRGKFSVEHRKKLSEAKLKNPAKYWQGKKRSLETRIKIADKLRGDNPKRFDMFWREARKKALKRDNNKCQRCGSDKYLDVHHIKEFKISQDNSLENLRTLCKSCHNKIEPRGIALNGNRNV